jgi:DNA primase
MGGVFSPATLEQVRAANDIVDVIGSYLPLKRAGANFVALCPFHREKTPSFNVNPHRQIFHCFGCHKGGDIFTFVQELESVDFPEAVRRLAERGRVPLEYEKGSGEGKARHLKETLLQIHEQITQRWQAALTGDPAGQVARDYLSRRKVSGEAIKLFRLGYAPDLWDDTVNWARSKGHDLEAVEKAGLVLRKEETGGYYDRFRGRLMFPICDEQGRVIGFSGRVLSGDEKAAKYVNSPETPIFSKSKTFYGIDKSRRALLEAGQAIVCEGQLDLIACYMAGVQNVVAPQGTAFTAEHARIIKRYVDEVVLCFDSDEAGQNAAVRSLDHLLASGLAVRVAVMPAPHDPDSFIGELGAAAFQALLAGAKGFFDYYLERLCAANPPGTDKGRLAVLRGMAEAVLKTGNRVLIDAHAQKTALRLGVSPDAVRAEFQKAARRGPVRAGIADTPEPVVGEDVPRPSAPEFWLLKLVLADETLANWAAARFDPEWVRHPLARQAIVRRLDAHRTGTWRSVAAFLDQLEGHELRELVTEAATDDRPIPDPARQLADILTRLRKQSLERQISTLTLKAGQPETSESDKLEWLRQSAELRRLKNQPFEVPGDSGAGGGASAD